MYSAGIGTTIEPGCLPERFVLAGVTHLYTTTLPDMNNHIAKVSVNINAPVEKVWDAFVNPAVIKQYMFGTTVTSDFTVGSDITWKGEWQGKQYEDKGKILELDPLRTLQYTHFSPMTGLPDVPGNYHTVTVELDEQDKTTTVSLSQDKNATEQEKAHSEKNWKMMLEDLKKLLEKNS
jgi:uncharacterized protein YndB with AHSA1/START domain